MKLLKMLFSLIGSIIKFAFKITGKVIKYIIIPSVIIYFVGIMMYYLTENKLDWCEVGCFIYDYIIEPSAVIAEPAIQFAIEYIGGCILLMVLSGMFSNSVVYLVKKY